MQWNCVTGGLLVNWWPSQCCSNSAAPTSPWLVATSHPDEHFSAMGNYWLADYDVRDRFKGKSWVEQVRGWTGQGSAGWTWSSRRPTTPASTTSSTGATVASVDNDIAESSLLYRQIEISIMTAGTTRKGKHFREGDPRSQKSNQPMRRSSSKYSLFIYCSLFRSSLRSSTLNLRPGDKIWHVCCQAV